MRHLIAVMVIALGGHAAWAQEMTDPVQPEDEDSLVEEQSPEPSEGPGVEVGDASGETTEPDVAEDTEDSGEFVEDTGEVVEDTGDVVGDAGDVVEDTGEVAEDTGDVAEDTGDVVEDDADEEPAVTERYDNRSPRGAERGGHRGSVSTMARAGLGPVFGALRSQGYGTIEITEADGQILVSASRAGETRSLVYDAGTGALLNDVTRASPSGFVERLVGRAKKATVARGAAMQEVGNAPSDRKGGPGRGAASMRGGAEKSDSHGRGGGYGGGMGGGGKGGGNGGGNGKGGGRDR